MALLICAGLTAGLDQSVAGAQEGAFLVRTRFADFPDLKGVTEIKFGELHPSPGPELGFAGYGVVILGRGEALVRMRYPGKRLLFADVDNNGETEMVEEGMEWAASRGAMFPLTLRDQRGKEVWSYDASKWGEQHGIYPANILLWAETVTGDLDGDGATDIVIWGAAPIHLQRIDATGKKIWMVHQERSGRIQIHDIDGQPGEEIVHSHGGDWIRVRDAAGEKMRDMSLPQGGSVWTVVGWVPGGRQPSLLVSGGATGVIGLHDLETAKLIITLDAPDAADAEALLTSAVSLAQGAPPHLAVAKRTEDGCNFYLFDSRGDRVFADEPEGCLALSAIPSGPGVERILLAGGGDTVWQYRAGQQCRELAGENE